MKYAIFTGCDQTIAYIANDDGTITIQYAEAHLWDSREDAYAWVDKQPDKDDLHIEMVEDEPTWRAQGATW